MPSANSLRRKLTSKVINNLGLDTVMLRSDPNATLDAYGEQQEPWDFDSTPIKIVIDTDKRDTQDGLLGGLPDPKKEYLVFFCAGDFDLRVGDKIVYPAGSENQWLVDVVQPQIFKGVCVITEARAYRDTRY